MRRILAIAAILLGSLASAQAQAPAQSWPQRNVTFILPLGPGSGVDITARLLADKLSAKWGKPVVIENRPGGDAIVAINAFTSANDDHTFLMAPTSTFTAHPLLHAKLPYDAARPRSGRARHQHADRDRRAGFARRQHARRIRETRQGKARRAQLCRDHRRGRFRRIAAG